MGGQEEAKLDEARLLGAKSGNRGLNLGIATYSMATGAIPGDPAAASNDARKYFPAPGAVSGLNMNAARLMPGAISFSRLSHLPPMAASMFVNPVMLPPGRGRPATKPEPTGSLTIANTIGMVPVSRCNAAVTAVVEQKITSGCDPISSVTKALARLVSPFVHRCSNRTLRPSVQPNRASSAFPACITRCTVWSSFSPPWRSPRCSMRW